MPFNIIADSFHTKKLCSRFSSNEVRFYTKERPFCVFWASFGNLGATHDDHLRLTGKRVVDLLPVLIELLLVDWPKISVALPTILLLSITIWTHHSFVFWLIMRLTDGQTDRILMARPRLHYIQRGNTSTERGRNINFIFETQKAYNCAKRRHLTHWPLKIGAGVLAIGWRKYQKNKKLRSREEHRASVVLSWCTFNQFKFIKQQRAWRLLQVTKFLGRRSVDG